MRSDYCEEIPWLYSVGREYHYSKLSEASGYETADESPAPNVDRWVGSGPAAGVVA